MNTQELAFAFNAIQWQIPFDGLVHVRNDALDECIEPVSDVALPTRHCRDVSLDGRIAIGLRDLWIATCKKSRLGSLTGRSQGRT